MSNRSSGGRAPRRGAYSRDDYDSGWRRPSAGPSGGNHGGGSRGHDGRHAPPRQRNDRLPHVDSNGTDMIKVSGTSHTKAVAGKIAHDLRGTSRAPTILAVGPASINVALKAIAVARSYLVDDDLDISCQPAFREGMSDLSLAIYLHSIKGNRYNTVPTNSDELVAKAATMRKNLAGAIAQRVRGGEAVYVKASGSAAVGAAVGAICVARTYLEDDHLDVHCAPKFMKEELPNGDSTTYLRLDLSTEKS